MFESEIFFPSNKDWNSRVYSNFWRLFKGQPSNSQHCLWKILDVHLFSTIIRSLIMMWRIDKQAPNHHQLLNYIHPLLIERHRWVFVAILGTSRDDVAQKTSKHWIWLHPWYNPASPTAKIEHLAAKYVPVYGWRYPSVIPLDLKCTRKTVVNRVWNVSLECRNECEHANAVVRMYRSWVSTVQCAIREWKILGNGGKCSYPLWKNNSELGKWDVYFKN